MKFPSKFRHFQAHYVGLALVEDPELVDGRDSRGWRGGAGETWAFWIGGAFGWQGSARRERAALRGARAGRRP